MRSARCAVLLLVALVCGCSGMDGGAVVARLMGKMPQPDEMPVMLNKELPFRYPAALYAMRVQGNVSLRLFVDHEGKVHSDSTAISESSGNRALDSAALSGARELQFSPARRKGRAMAVTIIYPVYFRHPQGAPLPGDTILRQATARRDSA